MAKQDKSEIYTPFSFSIKGNNELYSVFWKFLFIPDVLVRLLFYFCGDHKEYLATNVIYYWSITFIAIASCLYFPLIYILTWKKANSFEGSPNLSVLAKIYVILSASISNFAYMVIGGARFFT